jgi:hypothetical protein
MPDVIAPHARQLGIARSYGELHQILRDRAHELDVSRLTLDDAAGLTGGHASKLLAPTPSRCLGATSMGLMLGAMGLALVVVEDAEALKRIQAKLPKRRASAVRPAVDAGPVSMAQALRNALRRNGRKGARARMTTLTPEQRSNIARQAARARWDGRR